MPAGPIPANAVNPPLHPPAAGAAIGAGSGLLLGAPAGAARGDWAGASVQSRYDHAYLQCMYANGNHLNLENFPAVGLHKPYSSDNLITDSAAGATAS